MKQKLFFLLLITSVVSQEIITNKTSLYKHSLDDICPTIQTVILPHPDPTLCQMFVVCQSGQPLVYECVEGFVFEPTLLSCIPGDQKQCVNTSEPNWKQICTDVSYAFLADPNVCWKFVFCLDGMATHFTCPVEEVWSQRDGACLPGNRNICEVLEIAETCQDRADGVLPHPHDCSRYLECSHGETTIVVCLHGEVFDNMLGKCVVGNTKTCQRHEDICNNQTDGTILKHPNECGLFVKCEKGIAVITECPAGEVFNHYVKQCAPGDVYSCKFSPLETVCQGKANGTLIPYPDSCNQFVRCSSGIPITWNCAEGQILHGPSRTCRPGNHESCELIVDACLDKPNGWVIEHPNYCQVFIRCQSQIVTIVECPLGEILRADVQVCVPGMPYACTYDPLEMMCKGRPDGLVYPHPTDCHSFIRCQSSQPAVENCDPGFIFRAATQRCVAGNANTCEYLDDTCAERPDGLLVHPQGCNLYLKCISGITTTIRCPDGEIFDPESRECAAGNADDCTLAPVTSEPPISIFCQSRPDGFYPHPTLCYEFIYCINRVTEILFCPKDMFWNADEVRCDYGSCV